VSAREREDGRNSVPQLLSTLPPDVKETITAETFKKRLLEEISIDKCYIEFTNTTTTT